MRRLRAERLGTGDKAEGIFLELVFDEGLGRYTMGAKNYTYTILGVPDYKYSIMGPKTLF